MIKSTILLSNLLFLTMIAWAQQGVKISHNIPQAVKQGSEFIVDVAVDKKEDQLINQVDNMKLSVDELFFSLKY